eukprot:scaffold183547_cov14-Tisochrysis_lutea.AAC.1
MAFLDGLGYYCKLSKDTLQKAVVGAGLLWQALPLSTCPLAMFCSKGSHAWRASMYFWCFACLAQMVKCLMLTESPAHQFCVGHETWQAGLRHARKAPKTHLGAPSTNYVVGGRPGKQHTPRLIPWAAKQAAKPAGSKQGPTAAGQPPSRTSPSSQPQPGGLHSRDKLFNEVKAFGKLKPNDAKCVLLDLVLR